MLTMTFAKDEAVSAGIAAAHELGLQNGKAVDTPMTPDIKPYSTSEWHDLRGLCPNGGVHRY